MLLVLKELRLERGIHQGQLAQAAGKSPNAWTKIENGQSPLTVDALFGACSAVRINPSQLILIAERLVPVFNAAGCYFHTAIPAEEDELLSLVVRYFSSLGYENLRARFFERVSVSSFDSPFTPLATPTVVRYCTEQSYRDWVDAGAPAVPMAGSMAATTLTPGI